ncbi:MAG: hypothetical protein IK016_02685 [Lachnospiraceae bacterium]|nr:hypothetical protein [Lachnospiraceae bacterium]
MAVIPVGLENPQTGKLQTASQNELTQARGASKAQAAPVHKTKNASEAFSLDLGADNALNGTAGTRTKSVSAALTGENPADLTASRQMDVVLAHTLSPEDYKKAKEDGYAPSEIEAGETVTMVDHIKASLLQSGVEIAGVTDDLDAETLQAITGSEAYARSLLNAFKENDLPLTKDNLDAVRASVEKAALLTAPDADAVLYLTENELPASVDSLYLAAHAAKGFQGGYPAKAGEGLDIAAIQPQIDDVIRQAGLDPADGNIQKEASLLLGAGVALTPSHLMKAHDIGALSFPLSEESVIRAAAAAIAAGKGAGQGDLTDPQGMLAKAAEIDQEVRMTRPEDVLEAVRRMGEADRELTLKDVTEAAHRAGDREVVSPAEVFAEAASQTADAQAVAEEAALSPAEEARVLTGRLQMEEIRLSMSISANLTMMRSGFSIDTAPLSELVEQLRSAVEQSAKALFSGSDEAAVSRVSLTYQASASYTMTNAAAAYRLYAETNIKVEYMRTEMPLGVIGAVADEFKTDTLDDIFSRATTWKTANSAYETMQTEVRRDLGDSFEKAFGNADALLSGIGMEATKSNLRAVRILGYNRMEISEANVSRVREADAVLDGILRDLRPAAVLDMIREGKNPLRMTLENLAETLRGRSESLADSEERYAQFLYKAEQSGEITEAERSSFIGIYRMFETLQKTDHAAIGTLLNTGEKMTIGNLLTATRTVRTTQGAGIELTADDGGLVKGRITNAIETQIETAFRYYSAEADRAYAHLAPEKLAGLDAPEEMELPAFADAMENMPADETAERAYNEAQLEQMRETLSGERTDTAREDAAAALEAGELPVTTTLLEAMRSLIGSRSRQTAVSLWEESVALTKGTASEEDMREAAKALRETLGEGEEGTEGYLAQMERMEENLTQLMRADGTRYTDYRAALSLRRQVSTAARFAEQGSFEIPVTANGRTVSMQVTLTADAGQGSGVSITYDTAEFGTVSAQMHIEERTVFANISTTYGRTPQVQSFMGHVVERLKTGISEGEHMLSNITEQSILYNVRTAETVLPQQGRKTNTKQLLRLARLFTEAVTL